MQVLIDSEEKPNIPKLVGAEKFVSPFEQRPQNYTSNLDLKQFESQKQSESSESQNSKSSEYTPPETQPIFGKNTISDQQSPGLQISQNSQQNSSPPNHLQKDLDQGKIVEEKQAYLTDGGAEPLASLSKRNALDFDDECSQDCLSEHTACRQR